MKKVYILKETDVSDNETIIHGVFDSLNLLNCNISQSYLKNNINKKFEHESDEFYYPNIYNVECVYKVEFFLINKMN